MDNVNDTADKGRKKLEGWQKRKLIFWFFLIIVLGIVYIAFTALQLFQDRSGEEGYWERNLNQTLSADDQAYVDRISADATLVTVGSYVETLKEINMKSSNYRMAMRVWFKWEGDPKLDMAHNFRVYNGTINKLEVLKTVEEDGKNYQLVSVDVTVFKNYWTKRFPLESHQLRYYIEPTQNIDTVRLAADSENSGTNRSLSIAGYQLSRFADGVHTQVYDSTYGQEYISRAAVTSEYMGQIELNRDGFGLYLKCFIALFGTSVWVFVTMFLCTFHHVDPLSMIPAALFGTVSNIMVGANLLPDALEVGLLEYVNIWGIFTILAGAGVIITINRIRNKYKDIEFAGFFGRIMAFSLLGLVIAGHVLLPVSAYML